MSRLLNKNENVAILLGGIFAIIVGIGVARFVFTSLLPPMLEDYLTITFAGILASLNFAGYLSGSIISIFVNDIKKKVVLFRIGLIISIVSTIVLGLTKNETLWLVARIFAGLGSAFVLVIGSAIVMMKLNMESKTKAMGIHFSGIGISILSTDLISRIALSYGFNWENTWIILASIAVILSIYSMYILSFDKDIHQKNTKHPFDIKIFTPFVILLICAYFAEGVGFVVQATFLPDIINNIKGLEGFGNFTWTLVGIAGIPSCIIWLRLAHKYGSVNIIMIALFIQCIGILIPTFTTNLYLNLLSGVLYGGTFVGLVGLFMNLGGSLAKHNPVILMGALTTSYGIGQVIAPLYSVYFIKIYGSYDYSLYLTAFIVFGGIVLLFLGKKLQKEKC